jgi:hypothetical protein
MIDFSMLTEYFVLIVLLACLVAGYILKHASFLKWIPNDDIPGILAVIGAIVNVIVSGASVDSIVFGAIMGLASTGLHQSFKKWLDNLNTK